ncbi:MAG: VOC family protein [Actinobacteria bacterium]|nr:MAG: VOC family protein [Actinomycetota bacterium]
MAERTKYAPGTFSWADLATTDLEAAKRFYGGLFGWQAEDMPVPGGAYYSMQRVDGKDVAAIAPQPPAQRDAGVPPTWQSYITVESADAAAQRAGELGGTVHAEPFDVMEAGRMAVIQDPQGAFFMVWQANNHIGASLVNAPGALCWNELASPDLDAAPDFYGKLFGWSTEPFEGGPMRYLTIKNGDATNGGMREKQPQEPPYWLVYFAVEDVEASMARASELGGNTIAGPFEMAMGKIGVVQDPQGAVFALYTGRLEP